MADTISYLTAICDSRKQIVEFRRHVLEMAMNQAANGSVSASHCDECAIDVEKAKIKLAAAEMDLAEEIEFKAGSNGGTHG